MKKILVIIVSVVICTVVVFSLYKESSLDKVVSTKDNAPEREDFSSNLAETSVHVHAHDHIAGPIEEELAEEKRLHIANGPQPFEDGIAAEKFSEFLDQFNNTENPITEEEIQAFFGRMGATLNKFEQAREQISEIYRASPEDRYIITEMINHSIDAPSMLLKEADYILATGDSGAYPDMFQIYMNYSKDIEPKILEKAIEFAGAKQSDHSSLAALYVLGKASTEGQLPAIHYAVARNTLENIVASSNDEMIQTTAAQNLYIMTPPKESSNIAVKQLSLHGSNKSLAIETLYSIEGGDVAMNDKLEQVLNEVLIDKELTDYEQALVDRLLMPAPTS